MTLLGAKCLRYDRSANYEHRPVAVFSIEVLGLPKYPFMKPSSFKGQTRKKGSPIKSFSFTKPQNLLSKLLRLQSPSTK